MRELYIATGDSFARVMRNGTGWIAREGLQGQGIRCIAVDPANQEIIYAGSHNSGLWKSTDRGGSWQNLSLPEVNVYSIAVSAADGRVYAGTEPSKLFMSTNGGQSWEELAALRSIPSAPTWSFPPKPWTSHVRWIAPNPQNGNLLLVGIEQGGVMISEDGGQTWQDHRTGAVKDVHELAWHPQDASRAYEAAGGGAAWSSDAGKTWSSINGGRNHHYLWALAVDPEDPDKWFVSASHDAFDAHSGYFHGDHHADATLYRWRGNGPWEALAGLSKTRQVMPYSLEISGDLLIAGFADGALYSSTDDGDSWQEMAVAGQPINRISAIAAVP